MLTTSVATTDKNRIARNIRISNPIGQKISYEIREKKCSKILNRFEYLRKIIIITMIIYNRILTFNNCVLYIIN
jgi:hypothetical protein